MDRQRLFGKEIEVEFARGDRKSINNLNTKTKTNKTNQYKQHQVK